MDTTNLVAWLPFDESATQDLCGNIGNTWTATGNATLSTEIKKFGASSVHLPNGAYLTANNVIDLNADKWTFDCWAYLVSSSSDEGYFALSARTGDARYGIINANDGIWIATTGGGSWQAKNTNLLFPSVKNQWVHLAVVKNGSTVTFYQDGVSVWSFTTSALNNSGAFILGGNYYGYDTDIYFDELRFFDGTALHTENFSPPTSDDYFALALELDGSVPVTLNLDVKRKVSRSKKTVAQYISFTGASDCYGILPTGILPSASIFTIEVKFSTTVSSVNSVDYLCPHILGRTGGNEFGLYIHNGKLCFWASTSSTRTVTSSAVVNDGQIHRVAVVASGGAIFLYCDDVLVKQLNNSNAKTPSSPMYIAWNSFGSTPRLQMDLHELRFWSVARSQADIFADIEGDEEGLEAWYIPNENGLLDYSGNKGNVTLYGSPVYTELTEIPVMLNCVVARKVQNYPYLLSKITAYLSFDKSATQDLYGNEWAAYGSPTIQNGKLVLDGQSYLEASNIELGGRDFTISGKFLMNSSSNSWCRLLEFNVNGSSTFFAIVRNLSNNNLQFEGKTPWVSANFTNNISASVLGTVVNIECDYVHDSGKLYIFYDGILQATVNTTFSRQTVQYARLGASKYESGRGLNGTIDEFQIYDGIALHTKNFIPLTEGDYIALKAALVSKAIRYLSFTGNTGCYAELPLSVLPGATTFTIEAKFSTTSTKNTTNNWTWGTIAGREIGDHWQDDFGLCVNGGKLCFWAEPKAKNSLTLGTGGVFSNAIVNDGAIHDVAVVSSNGAIDLYCDGLNVAHTDNVNAKISAAQTILLANDSNPNSFLQMDLYEARFWSIARTQEEIFADIEGTENGLQAWYLPSQGALNDYSGNGRHATLYGNPAYTELETLPVTLTMDVERKVKNDAKIINSMKVWLPFDESTTLDKCGNTWTAYGTPTISETNAINGKALQLNGSSYLSKSGGITLGGQDFTIDGWFNLSSSSGNYCRIFSFHNANSTTENCINLARNGTSNNLYTDCMNSTSSNFAVALNENHYFAYVYQHNKGKVKIFIDGKLKLDWSKSIARTTFPNVFIGKSNWNDGYPVGSIDEFRVFDGIALHTANFTPPTAADYEQLKMEFGVIVTFYLDTKREIVNKSLLLNYLKVWLPFNSSVTEDLCGNEWNTIGSPSIDNIGSINDKSLQLDGSSCLKLNGSLSLGGKDFTICGWATMNSSAGTWGGLFALNGNSLRLIRYNAENSAFERGYKSNLSKISVSPALTNRFHFEIDYVHSTGKWYTFFNGVLKLTYTNSLNLTTYANVFVGGNGDNSSTGGGRWGGSIDEFQIYDGIALHTENFDVPKPIDYVDLGVNLFNHSALVLYVDVVMENIGGIVEYVSDIARKINNFIEVFYDVRRLFKWRYENTGIADLLSISGTTLTDLPATQSRTGTAFYQTARAKCFDVPATAEVWIKFDVYFDGTNRWRAYNGGSNGTTGIASWESTELDFCSNNTWVREADFPLVANQLQTVLLHMVSSSTDGIIEAWVDGEKIYTYTGDVNHGQDFNDIYLQSDGSGTFFSNVIISNAKIGLDETLDGKSVVVLFDVEISIGRLISLYLDTKCIVITQETVEQLSKFASALKVWLPFDTSPVADVCSNEWLAYGNPIIQNKELVLNGSSYLKMYLPLTITRNQTFVVGCWFSATNNIAGKALYLWCLHKNNTSYVFLIDNNNTLKFYSTNGSTDASVVVSTGVTDGKKHYLEAVFDSGKALGITIDGIQVAYIKQGLPNYWNNSSITTLDYEVGVGCDLSYANPTSSAFIGTIDEFQIYDGVSLHGVVFTPPIEASYVALHSKILENPINVIVDVMRLVKDDTCLKVHLTFDEDVTTDECGNEWTAVGNPTISEEHAVKGKALQLDKNSYLTCNSTFTIEEGQPFTIDCWVYITKIVDDYAALCSLGSGNIRRFVLSVYKGNFANSDKQVYHCALVSDGLNVYKFVDGTLLSRVSLVKNISVKQQYALQNAELCIGRSVPGYSERTFTGTIDEFRLIIGDALWTEPFTPSITGEILDWTKEVVLNCDVMCIVNNVEEPWIYYNIGVANDISRGIASTRNNLPANYSRTGCAIWGGDFGFPVPATYNFWIRFDFTPQVLGFFWSEHKSEHCGVDCIFYPAESRTTAYLYIVCGSYYGYKEPISANATRNESATVLHTVLLHIKSGLTDGIVEAWVDKTENGDVNYLIGRYVGNVNDGVPIYDFYIRSNDYFSNIIISNEPITFESAIPETHIIELVLDVERQLTSNFVTYNLDIIRNVIAPITIPLSEGNIEYTLNRIRICSIPQKFILPKISKFYIYGDLVGKVHIYSDTNIEGIINGSYYFAKNSIQSEFIESNEFYIVLDTSIISAQDVIKLFIYKLVTNRLSDTYALNRAVIYATDGRYVSWNDFINQFLNCLNSMDYKRFLDFYCDIILDNNDTGAILGWDAGGVAIRTAINVVTESSSTDAWKVPVLGSSIMISNLLVHFPQYGVSGSLTNIEEYILSGLNSEWIYRSLELIKYSLGISFEDSDITYEMYIQFSRDSSSGDLAHISAGKNDTSCILTINMYYYSSMDITDVNGLSEHANIYLDRTIVHELVHAVMELRSYAHYTLPHYIIEGLAELIHGIDDDRKNNIVELLTTRKNDLISALTSEQYVYPEDAYSVGYILLRFLAKQGQHINNTSTNKLIINNLLVVNDSSLVIKTVQCDVTTVINNYVIIQCDITTVINNYVIIQCDITINHYMIIEYVLDVYHECVVSIVEFIPVQIDVMYLYTISTDVFRRIIGLNVTKFNIMMYGVSNVHINSVTFNVVMYGVSSSISSSIKFVIVDPSKTRTKLHLCMKPVAMLMLKPINNIMIADQVSDLALRSTPLYPDRSNKGYNTRG